MKEEYLIAPFEEETDAEGYNPQDNYCTLCPEKLFGVHYNYACYLHDRHYRNERKYRKTRKEADKMLKDLVFKAFKKKNKIIIGFIWSNCMYIAVRIFSKNSWKE